MIDGMEIFQDSLVQLLGRGAIVLCVSFSAAFLLRRRAQYVRLVWVTGTLLLLALPMLQPFQVWSMPAAFSLSGEPEQTPATKNSPSEAMPRQDVQKPALRESALEQGLIALPGPEPAVEAARTGQAQAGSEGALPLDGRTDPSGPGPWLAALWLVGVILGMGHLALGRLILWRLRSGLKPPTAPWVRSLAEVRERMGTDANAKIFFVPEISMPLTVGIVSPEIWLPESARDFDRWHRESVLSHELAHIRGRDSFWQLLSSLVLTIHWLNPLAWIANRSFRLAQERVCDDGAMGAEDAAPENYAKLLLEVARNAAANRSPFQASAAPVLMMAQKSSLERRIRLILDKNMKRKALSKRQAWLTMAVVTCLGLPMALVGCGKESPSETEQAETPSPGTPAPVQLGGFEETDEGAARLKRKISAITLPEVRMKDMSLKEAIDILRESSIEHDPSTGEGDDKGIDFVLLRSAMSRLNPESGPQGMEELRRAIGGQEDKVEDARKILTTISRTKGFVDRQAGAANDRPKNEVETRRQLEADKVRLEAQIKFLLKFDSEQLLIYASGLDLPDNIIKTLYPRYLQLKREIDGLKASGLGDKHPSVVTSGKVLEAMKEQLDEGVVNLRTRLQGQLEVTKERLANTPESEPKKERLEAAIDMQDYVDAKRAYETEQALLEKMKLSLMEAELNGHTEVNPHLVNLDLRQVPFEDALKYVVQQAGLSYAIHPSAVVIGTPEEIKSLEPLDR